MKVVLQRVSEASVSVEGDRVASIRKGLVLLVGVAGTDTPAEADAAAMKISSLRVFGDEAGRMNRSVVDVEGEVLVVSQFTLFGDVSKGRRPSFSSAAPPDQARPLVDRLVAGFESEGIRVSNGVFGARMEVSLINDGPVTLTLEFRDGKAV